MSTLLIRLAGPLQSWGLDSKFDRRGTQRAPTKSGVLGLLAAALGRRRNEPLDDLQALRFGVRVDREGILIKDIHNAHEEAFWVKHDGKYAHLTTRYYLSDAVFVAGLEGDEALLAQIAAALRAPAFSLFLGRRSCPPEGRLLLSIRPEKTLLQALQEEPWLGGGVQNRNARPVSLRIAIDADESGAGVYFVRDVPLSFNQTHRQFGFRRVSELSAPPVGPRMCGGSVPESPTDHDPIRELEG